MNRIKDYLYYLYLAVLTIASIFMLIRHVEAGIIRKLQVSVNKPGTVRLAYGRNTTIAFSSRPEKVVAGSPQSIEVNFIGRDLSVRPLQANPGNLTVYTKSERIVILFQIAGSESYDDVVEITPSTQGKKKINLLRDTYK